MENTGPVNSTDSQNDNDYSTTYTNTISFILEEIVNKIEQSDLEIYKEDSEDIPVNITKSDEQTVNENCNIDFNRQITQDENTKENDVEYLKQIIEENKYVQKTTSNKSKDPSSLSSLVDSYHLSQSDCIKLGVGLENVLREIILKLNPSVSNIKPPNSKGQHEKDHLFMDQETKTVYYAEIKSNLNLDTEKSVKTYSKCKAVKEELQKEYPEYKVLMFLVGGRYHSKSIMSSVISQKYTPINESLVGINEYLSKLNVNFQFSEQNYKEFINHLSKKMFKY